MERERKREGNGMAARCKCTGYIVLVSVLVQNYHLRYHMIGAYGS